MSTRQRVRAAQVSRRASWWSVLVLSILVALAIWLSGAWDGLTDMPIGLADRMDNDTACEVASRLCLTDTLLSADEHYLRRRVEDSCPQASAIRVVKDDGTIDCEPASGAVYLTTDVLTGATAVGLSRISPLVRQGVIWLVIDPFTDECEIRKPVSHSSIVAFEEPLIYEHSAGDPVILTTAPVFDVGLYGLKTGRGYTASVHASNAIAISRAVKNAGLLGGGKVTLPAGGIELDTLSLASFPDYVNLIGAGRDVTTLYPQATERGGQLRVEGKVSGIRTFLTGDAHGSDIRLRVNDVRGFATGDPIRIRDLSTDGDGNGSWPYGARPGLHNGEYLYIENKDADSNTLSLVTPVQSSIDYQVHKTTVVSPGVSQGGTHVPVADTTGYEIGAEVAIIQDDARAHVARVVSVHEGTTITIDEPVASDVSTGSNVYVYVEVSSYAVTEGVRLADFSVRLGDAENGNGGLALSYLDGFSVENVAVYGAGWAGIWLSGCVNGRVSGFLVQDGEYVGSHTGYGVQTYHCQWVTIGEGVVRQQRRAIDLSGEHPSRFVDVHDNLLEGSSIVEWSTVAGTHGTAENCSFTDNIIVGGNYGGLLIRGNRITVKGNQFVGTDLAAIVLVDGAYWDIVGNTVSGHKSWGVESSGRFVNEFIRLQAPHAVHLTSRGNVVRLESTHINVRGNVQDSRLWVSDDIVFRPSAPGQQNIVLVSEGSSVVLNVRGRALHYDNVYAGGGRVVEDNADIVVALDR